MWKSSLILLLVSSSTYGFVPQATTSSPLAQKRTTELQAKSKQSIENALASSLLAASVAVTVASSPVLPAQAYSSSDYASETVKGVIAKMKESRGNLEGTFQTYETVAEIITEGKGVGGMVNYSKC